MVQQESFYTSFSHKFSTLISPSLKGFSQVLLVRNSFTGSLILLGITLHSPILGLIAFLSSLVGTITAKFIGGNHHMIHEGIYGFNSVLCGIAPVLFLHGDKRWFIALLAAAISALLMAILSQFLTKWRIPVLTIPFVIVTWIGLLAAYRFENIDIDPSFVISSPTLWNLETEGKPTLIIGLIKGIGEVFIIDSLWTGSLILVGLFWAGWRFGVYAIIGAFLSWMTAYFIGVDSQSLNLGLYNYNAVLTIIAVSVVYGQKRLYVGMFAATLTVPITAGLELLLDPLGLPALTFPFIFCSWLFIGARKLLLKGKK